MTVEDNGIGMSRDEHVEALGTIARSGTKAFLDRIEAGQKARRRRDRADRPVRRRLLFGLHGGRAGRGDFAPRRDGDGLAVVVRRQGSFRCRRWHSPTRPARGTRVVLHLMDDARQYAERVTVEPLDQGAIGPRAGADRDRREAGRASRPKSPTARRCGPSRNPRSRRRLHRFLPRHRRPVRRAGRRPSITAPKAGRIIRRCSSFPARGRSTCSIRTARAASSSTSSASSSPTMPTFCRAICASCAAWSTAPICRSMSRAKRSRRARCSPRSERARPAACSSELERLADKEPETYAKIWEIFGAVLKEGIYEDFERRDAMLALARFQDHGVGGVGVGRAGAA